MRVPSAPPFGVDPRGEAFTSGWSGVRAIGELGHKLSLSLAEFLVEVPQRAPRSAEP